MEVDANTQTEAFQDRPPSPLFLPAKNGADKASQVDVKEIFDFDSEVAPMLEVKQLGPNLSGVTFYLSINIILGAHMCSCHQSSHSPPPPPYMFSVSQHLIVYLKVLVGKTLQTAMLEVLEEEELAAIRRRQDEFEAERNAELLEVQRLEAEAARKLAEKKRRVMQEKERKRLQQDLKEKVAARSFARTYLAEMNATVFAALEREGQFYDPVKREIDEVFLPWLLDGAVAQAQQVAIASSLADDILRSALAQALALQAAHKLKADEAAAIEAAQAEAAAKAAAAAAAQAASQATE